MIAESASGSQRVPFEAIARLRCRDREGPSPDLAWLVGVGGDQGPLSVYVKADCRSFLYYQKVPTHHPPTTTYHLPPTTCHHHLQYLPPLPEGTHPLPTTYHLQLQPCYQELLHLPPTNPCPPGSSSLYYPTDLSLAHACLSCPSLPLTLPPTLPRSLGRVGG